ncbi:Maf family protein [Marinobacter orientalis]|uniref:dTTP/UTP pyrophosphatase n=1 Tax=Marinobacter orientalis TaxID=1928859 RepID=A0A7Y0RF86_9GAMM|nr:Maf family protein [Marinobacter orientalis]NMT65167.1 septum formation inhibitor Maf [Marinobacter orientalis]TGX48060.1 septum formation inhibitor Maf [Marinobacter orientalis]
MTTIVLASASPRRAELLRQIGLSFRVCPADIDETPGSGESALHYVERLAREKALAAKLAEPGAIVIGSDTSVVLAGRILGKPRNRQHAMGMLRELSGATHQVMTAVAIASVNDCEARVAVTDVRFRPLSGEEIAAYVATGEPMDKAGGYGIQGRGGIFVEELRGSYSAVVGLPLQETAELLAAAGCPVWQTWNRSQESNNE